MSKRVVEIVRNRSFGSYRVAAAATAAPSRKTPSTVHRTTTARTLTAASPGIPRRRAPPRRCRPLQSCAASFTRLAPEIGEQGERLQRGEIVDVGLPQPGQDRVFGRRRFLEQA